MENLETLLAIMRARVEETKARRETLEDEGALYYALMGQETAYRDVVSEIQNLEIEELLKR